MIARLIDIGLVLGLFAGLLLVRLVGVFAVRWVRAMAAARRRGEWGRR